MGIWDIFSRKEQTKAEKKAPEAEKIAEKPERPQSYEFTEQDRERALEARRQASERRALIESQNQRLKDLQAQRQALDLERQIKRLEKSVYGDEDDSDEDDSDDSEDDGEGWVNIGDLAPIIQGLISGYSSKAVQNVQAAPILQTPPTAATPGPMELTKDEIEDFIKLNPEIAAKAQRMPDSLIIKGLRSYFPTLSDESGRLAVDILKKTEIKMARRK